MLCSEVETQGVTKCILLFEYRCVKLKSPSGFDWNKITKCPKICLCNKMVDARSSNLLDFSC
jgi:hypothetical protein